MIQGGGSVHHLNLIFLSLPSKRRRLVIPRAEGPKDLLPQQILRYARVPRASLRMTGSPLLIWEKGRKEKDAQWGGAIMSQDGNKQ